ncbi:type IV pilus secretin lipoprotein PilQ [Geotalea uraniireducens]|uniref:Type IV pilus secretin lipoprotein PilQ n=1 Tax=Geotalea uraniireducens TaxID=351604 RepID=A0ABM8EN82_9BACT|nr:type IV pilus secretin PilQ [Geotalea uraniireducens]BDV43678.1 type IV pilus secretin lipoprotein PilQ [Geotalea uraniireducens]
MRIQMKLFRKLALASLVTIFCGCAGANSSMKSDQLPGQVQGSVLREVSVVGDGATTQVVIAANKPLVYTFYKTDAPPKAVVDLAQVDVGSVVSPQEINKGIIKRIVTAHYGEGAAAMTRVEVYLARDAEVTATADPQDKGVLRLSILSREAGDAQAPVAVSSVPAAEKPAETSTQNAAVDKAKNTVPVVETTSSNSSATEAPAASAKAEKPVDTTVNEEPVAKGPVVVSSIVAAKDSIDIITSGPVADYKSFSLTKPDRFVIDLFAVKSGFESRVVPVNSLNVGTARIGAYPDKVRIVLDAAEGRLPAFAIDRFASGLKVVPASNAGTSGKGEEAIAVTTASVKAAPVKVAEPAAHVEKKKLQPVVVPSVESIDFKELADTSRLVIAITEGCDLDKAVKTADGLTFTIKNCLLPRKWQRYLDTSAFAGSIERVTPYQVKVQGRHDVKVQVKLRNDVPYELKQEGGNVYLDVKNLSPAKEHVAAGAAVSDKGAKKTPPTVARDMSPDAALMAIATPTAGGKVYTGRRVTLEFSDADIRKIFQLIAEVSNLNFIVGDDVTGTISLKLVNVPWDQALDVILENKGLGMQREGNIVQIRPRAKIQTLADEQQALHKAEEKAMPLKTEVFDINFASVSDVASQFNALKSERGTITQDARTNRVIVKDIEPAIKEMKFLLKNLDIPERQVLIEARIVEATSTFTRDLGVQWGIHYKDGAASFANINGLDAGFGGVVVNTPASSGFQAADSSGGAVGISFGSLASNINVDMRLSAAAVAGLIKIISTPKVVTLNNKSAKISQGQSIPYQTTSAEGTKTEFVEAALTLEVTPHITSDGSISMKIKATNNSAGTGSPPPINKKEATTELLVKNSETTVIGGIYVDSDTDEDQGVPFLMDIPLLGWLFKSNTKTKTKTELLIFITPKIVS